LPAPSRWAVPVAAFAPLFAQWGQLKYSYSSPSQPLDPNGPHKRAASPAISIFFKSGMVLCRLERVPVELTRYFSVMPGLVPGIHVFLQSPRKRQTWMAGTSPAMTPRVDSRSSERALIEIRSCFGGENDRIIARIETLLIALPVMRPCDEARSGAF
jgi:hypothetical protein